MNERPCALVTGASSGFGMEISRVLDHTVPLPPTSDVEQP